MASTRGGRSAFAFLGGCVLLPYNCLLTSQPYFNDYPFKGMQFPFTSMIAYSVCLCLGQGFLTFRGENLALNCRMVVALVGTTIVCIALLLVTLGAHFIGGIGMYLTGLGCVAALGVLNALMQTAILGLASTIGPEMSAACMLGFGLSGIFSLVLSLLVQAVDKPMGVNEEMNGLVVTIIEFAFCFFYTLASAEVYRRLTRDVPAAAEAIGALERRRSSVSMGQSPRSANSGGIALMQDSHPCNGEHDGKGSTGPAEARAVAVMAPKIEEGTQAVELASPVDAPEASTLQRTLAVLREILPQAFNVWLVFAVTMLVFPGVLLQWEPLKGSLFVNSTQLFGTLLIGCFQVFDVVGRTLVGCFAKFITPPRLWILVALRCIFVPIFILGQREAQWCVLWGSDAGRLFLSAALACTNGLFASLSMMYGPGCCPNERREVAGMAMSCTMVTGIFSGSLLALLTQL